MAQHSPHPTILSPASRFTAQIYSTPSRSPSRSPTRPAQLSARDIDPLLANLSPTSTLEALRATDYFPPQGHQRQVLSDSISDASTSERALAVRAALAGKKLKEWYAEVKEWQWPESGFEEPSQTEKQKKYRESDDSAYLDEALGTAIGATRSNGYSKSTYWGSLPAHTVESYERRIEAIKDELELLDVEELKEHVRGAHLHQKTHLTASYTDSPSAGYSRLDDFTVIITATIMQALPYLARLTSLLDVWSIRIIVLRQVPGFLRQLEDARIAVNSASNAISRPTSSAGGSSDLTRDGYATMKYVLQDRVSELGQRIDAILDSLEGSADSIPDHWIDSMEKVQEDYETWVVDAERQVEENEWRFQVEAAKKEAALRTTSEEVAKQEAAAMRNPEEAVKKEDLHSLKAADLARQVINGSTANSHTSKVSQPLLATTSQNSTGEVSDNMQSVRTTDLAGQAIHSSNAQARADESSQPIPTATRADTTIEVPEEIQSLEATDLARQISGSTTSNHISEISQPLPATTSNKSVGEVSEDFYPVKTMDLAGQEAYSSAGTTDASESSEPVSTATRVENTEGEPENIHAIRAADLAKQVINGSTESSYISEISQPPLATTSNENTREISNDLRPVKTMDLASHTNHSLSAKPHASDIPLPIFTVTRGESTKGEPEEMHSSKAVDVARQVINGFTASSHVSDIAQPLPTTTTNEDTREISHNLHPVNTVELAGQAIDSLTAKSSASEISQPIFTATGVESTKEVPEQIHSLKAADLAWQVINGSTTSNRISEFAQPLPSITSNESTGEISNDLHPVNSRDLARQGTDGSTAETNSSELSQPISPATRAESTKEKPEDIPTPNTTDFASQVTAGSATRASIAQSHQTTVQTASTEGSSLITGDDRSSHAVDSAVSVPNQTKVNEGLQSHQLMSMNTIVKRTGPQLYGDHSTRAEFLTTQVFASPTAKTEKPGDWQFTPPITGTAANQTACSAENSSSSIDPVYQESNGSIARSETSKAIPIACTPTGDETTQETISGTKFLPATDPARQLFNKPSTNALMPENDQDISTTAIHEGSEFTSDDSHFAAPIDLARQVTSRSDSEETQVENCETSVISADVESTGPLYESHILAVTKREIQPSIVNRFKPLPATPPGEMFGEYTTDLSLHSESPFASNEGAFAIGEPAFEVTLSRNTKDANKTVNEPLLLGKKNQNHRPPPLELLHRPVTRDSITSTKSSDAVSPASDMSSPEILDASRVEYFKTPLEEKFRFNRDTGIASETVSRNSSQRTERTTISVMKASLPLESKSPASRSRASSFLPEDTIFEGLPSPLVENSENANGRPDLAVKRASIASIEVLPRSELRNITVIRSGSQSSISSGLSRRNHMSEDTSSAEQHKNSGESTSERQALSRTSSDDSDSSQSLRIIKHRVNLSNESSEYNLGSPLSLPPRTPSMAETPIEEVSTPIVEVDDHFLEAEATPPAPETPSPEEPRSIRSPFNRHRSLSQSLEDQLTARITSILTSIPAHIRLASGPEAEAPEVIAEEEPAESRERSPVRLPLRAPGPRSATPSITLAPAFSKTSKNKSHGNDSDIKLYHLHQPGKDAPIKLYVRLVGEAGERVMVRVGGGWADLGEYLKDYASHHGRRSVSDGRFEIKGLPTGQSSSSITTLVGRSSGRTTPTSRPESPVMRPGSSHNVRKARIPSAPLPNGNPSTPEVRIRSFDATPGSVDSNISARSSSFSWADEETTLGMAGPKSKKGDISPSKKAWVDVMLDQARKASAEKRKVSAGDFGDLGKVGGTRRIFLKAKAEE